MPSMRTVFSSCHFEYISARRALVIVWPHSGVGMAAAVLLTTKLTTNEVDLYSSRSTSMDDSPTSTCGDGRPWTSMDRFA